MRFVYILEDDPKFLREIIEAIVVVDPKVQIRSFKKLEEFADWVKILMAEGRKAIIKGGKTPEGFISTSNAENPEDAVLQLVISKVEFLGARQLGLMKKTRDLFIKHKVCTAEDPTAFVLTAFEDPAFHIRDLQDRILSNIILKPFDKLILQQDITFAIDGRHPPSKHAVAPYKTSAVIEVLKSVHMHRISTVGFVSSSDRHIEPGMVAKYYGNPFLSERQRSVIAKTVDCKTISKDENQYEVSVSFFGLDPTQISNIRRAVVENRAKKAPGRLSISGNGKLEKVRIIFLDDREEVVNSISPTLTRKIKGAEIVRYRNTKEFYLDLDPKLDTEKAISAFSTGSSVQLDLDKIGRLQGWQQKDFKLLDKELTNGFLMTNFLNDKEKIDLIGWLTKPIGSFVANWGMGEKSQILKLSAIKDKTFLLETASQVEKDTYLQKNNRLKSGVDFFFVANKFIDVERLDFWKDILDRLRKFSNSNELRSMILSAAVHTDAEEISFAEIFDDLHYIPVERVYLLQKMLLLNNNLQILDDPIETIEIPHNEIIKSARPAEIEELSEAGLVMKYEREMSLGSFREFVLWQPYEVGAPEITATCNFTEPGSSADEWKLHFVFFAMKDILLKAIRNWIRENYILSKDKS